MVHHRTLRQRSRRFERTRFVVLICLVFLATIAALAVPHLSPWQPTVGHETSATASPDIAPAVMVHPAAGDSDPSGCANCGTVGDGVAIACGLILFAALLIAMPRIRRRTWSALAPRVTVNREHIALVTVTRTPDLNALCISRT